MINFQRLAKAMIDKSSGIWLCPVGSSFHRSEARREFRVFPSRDGTAETLCDFRYSKKIPNGRSECRSRLAALSGYAKIAAARLENGC